MSMPASAGPGRRAPRWIAIALGIATAVALVGLVALVLPLRGLRDENPVRPAATLRDFLVAAVEDRDGVAACRYLTRRAQLEIETAGAPNAGCAPTMALAHLSLPGGQQESAVERLSYQTRQRGGQTSVSVSAHGSVWTFTLRTASSDELNEYKAPPTPWRIDTGVGVLLSPRAASS